MAKELVFDVKVNNLDSTQKSFGELKEDIKSLRKELESTPIGSDRFEELTAQIQEAGHQMREIKKDLKEMSVGAQQLGDLSEGASAIAKGFAMATSAAALFGEENKKAAEEAIKNIVALTSLAEGLGQLPKMAEGLGKAFDVLKANPFGAVATAIGLVVTAVGYLISNWDELKQSSGIIGSVIRTLSGDFDDLADSQDNAAESAKKYREQQELLSKELDNELNVLIKRNELEVKTGKKTQLQAQKELSAKLYEIWQQRLGVQAEINQKIFQLEQSGESENSEKMVELRKEQQDKLASTTNAYYAYLNSQIKEGETKTKKSIDKGNNEKVDSTKDAYNEMLKSEQDFISRSYKNLEDEYTKKETDLLVQFGDGRIKTEKELNDKLSQLQADKLMNQKSLLQQEIVDVMDNEKIKADDKIELITKLNDQVDKIDSDMAKKQVENVKNNNANLERADKESFEKRYGKEKLDIINKFKDGEIKTKEDLNLQLERLDLERAREELMRLDKNSNEYLQKQIEIANKEIELKQKTEDAKKAIEDKSEKDKKEKTAKDIDNISKIIGGVSDLFGSIGEVLQSSSNENINKINEERDAELQALEDKKEKGLVTAKEYEEKKKKITDDAKKKELVEKRKAFEQEKSIKILQAIASTAQAVITAFTGGPFVGPILAGIAAAVGAAQIAIISGQKFPEGGSTGGATSPGLGSTGGGGSSEGADLSKIKIPTFGFDTGAIGGSAGVAGVRRGTLRQDNPQKVYVVESDITKAQNRIEIVEERAKIG